MSTNYYLHRRPEPCPNCGHDPVAEPIHVGKSSLGWVFLWQGWKAGSAHWSDGPGLELARPSQWAEYLVAQEREGAVIRDEYGHDHTLGEFLAMVMAKRLPRKDGSSPLVDNDPQQGWLTDHLAIEGDVVSFDDFT